jgi:Fe-S cluster assembly protein SufD
MSRPWLLALAASLPLGGGVQLQQFAPPAGAALRVGPRRAAVRAAEPDGGALATASDQWLGSAVAARPAVAAGLEELRAEATAAVLEARRPGRKDEAWRRTDLSSLFAAALALPSGDVDLSLARDLLDSAGEGKEGAAAVRIVLVDGVFRLEMSDLAALPDGAYAGPLAGAAQVAPPAASAAMAASLRELPEKGVDHRTALGCYAFGALNQASLSDVFVLFVPCGLRVAPPVRLLLLSSGSGAGDSLAASHPNLMVWMEERSEMLLMQQYAGTGSYFTNGLTRIRVGDNATLSHAYVQEQSDEASRCPQHAFLPLSPRSTHPHTITPTRAPPPHTHKHTHSPTPSPLPTPQAVHIDSVLARCDRGGRYEAQFIQSGGRIARVNLGVDLAGRHAFTSLSGLALASDSQLSDLHSAVRHSSPDCASQQEQRNAVAGRARIVFRGAVQVPVPCSVF